MSTWETAGRPSTAKEGEFGLNTDTDQIEVYDGSAWIAIGDPSAVTTVTSSTVTLDNEDFVVICDATSNAITVNLPAASTSSSFRYYIKKIDSSANTVTIDANASETIDGDTTKILTSQYDSIEIVCDGSNWYII